MLARHISTHVRGASPCPLCLRRTPSPLPQHAQAHLATAGPDGPGEDPSGFWGANVAMLGGMLFFAGVVWLVPEGGGVAEAVGGGAGQPSEPASAAASSKSKRSTRGSASGLRKGRGAKEEGACGWRRGRSRKCEWRAVDPSAGDHHGHLCGSMLRTQVHRRAISLHGPQYLSALHMPVHRLAPYLAL